VNSTVLNRFISLPLCSDGTTYVDPNLLPHLLEEGGLPRRRLPASLPEDRGFETPFNFLQASPKDLVGVGIEQREMLHRMLDTFGSASKRNLSSASDSHPFEDHEFEIMYSMTVRQRTVSYFLALQVIEADVQAVLSDLRVG
jgi:hypothetical protein